MTEFKQTAVIGAGVIGASWTAFFVAAGMDVNIYDPSPTAELDVTDYVERAWPTLVELGLAIEGRRGPGSGFATAPPRRLKTRNSCRKTCPKKLKSSTPCFVRLNRVFWPRRSYALRHRD